MSISSALELGRVSSVRRVSAWGACLSACALATMAGCNHILGEGDAHNLIDKGHYAHLVKRVSYSPGDERPVLATDEPRRVLHPREDQHWDASLAEIQQLALANVAIIRDRSQFLSPSNALLASPDVVPSAFDPAIQEAGGPFGGRGVDAALADFDTSFTSGMLWDRDELVQNNRFLSGGLQPGETLTEETGVFTSRFDKALWTGGSMAVIHDWDYSLNNMTTRLYGSYYAGRVRGEFRQPLLAGSGLEFNRVAGPLARNGRGAVNQGVVIARLNTEISVLDFESRVQALLKNVEDAYWDLALAYKAYDAELASREAAHRLWEQIQGRIGAGLEGAAAADEAQARENYYERCVLADDALTLLYQREAQLRRLIGLPVNDGRLIRPAEDLSADDAAPDWHQSLTEALTHRIELRRQKSSIRGLCAQLRAARSLTQPQLDFVSGYHINGFGDTLIGGHGSATNPYPSAYGALADNDQTGWNLGVQFAMPLGFRAAEAQAKNLELRLAKANAVLAAQELEISHELANAFQLLDRWQSGSRFNQSRQDAAGKRVEALDADYRAGRTSVDLLLRAQVSLSQAQIAYFRSLSEFRKGVAELHYRKGTLLDQHNIALADGVWNPETYSGAQQRTIERLMGLPTESAPPPAPLEPPSKSSGALPVPPLPADEPNGRK